MANRKRSQTKDSRGCHLFQFLADLAPRVNVNCMAYMLVHVAMTAGLV